MALTPPNDNKGDFNSSSFAPQVWTDVQNTNNEIIDRNDMPFTSTVEYKGYYKAQSTGNHKFQLTGSTNVTGYSWVSSAPRDSDHIKAGNIEPVTLTSSKSYGVIIPLKRGNYWPWEDPSFLGTSFPGYGYWPKSNYGNSTGWSNHYTGSNAPFTTCGYTGDQAPVHQYFLPGDIRNYADNYPRFEGKRGGLLGKVQKILISIILVGQVHPVVVRRDPWCVWKTHLQIIVIQLPSPEQWVKHHKYSWTLVLRQKVSQMIPGQYLNEYWMMAPLHLFGRNQ